MRKRILTAAGIVTATAVLVVGVDGATYAATGGSLILGRANTANATTLITSTKGAALALRPSRTTEPPFTTTGSGRVPNLNADRLDSLDSTQLQRRLTGSCGAHQALVGVWATGAPACRNVDVTTLLASVSDPGLVDTPSAYRLSPVRGGRYSAVLSATMLPTVRGTAGTPKPARCQVQVNDKAALTATGTDNGTGNGATVGTPQVIVLPNDARVDVVCGFTAGTWKFAPGGAAQLALTPLPLTQPVTGSPTGQGTFR